MSEKEPLLLVENFPNHHDYNQYQQTELYQLNEFNKSSNNNLPLSLINLTKRNELNKITNSNRIKINLLIDDYFNHDSILSIDPWKRDLKFINSRKSYKFDSIFKSKLDQNEMCKSILINDDILKSVLNGTDSCLVSYGQNKKNKYKSIFNESNGLVSLALVWLFESINTLKLKSNLKFIIKLSALEITGKEERLKDLLIGSQKNSNKLTALKQFEFLNIGSNSCNNTLRLLTQIRVDTIEQAKKYLQLAVNSRSLNEHSHMFINVNLHQFDSEDTCKNVNLKSKLHLIDIGNLTNSKLTHMKLAQSLLAAINGQKQNIFSNESKLLCIMRETMTSSAECRISMLAHIVNNYEYLNENIQIVQLSAKIQKSVRKLRQHFYKSLNSGFDESSIEIMQLNNHTKSRMKKHQHQQLLKNDYTSSSEFSCDTVIYIGKNGKRNYLKNNSIRTQHNQLVANSNMNETLLNKPRPKLGVFSKYYNRKSNLSNPRSSSSSSTFSSSSSSMNSNTPNQTTTSTTTITTSTKPNEIWIDGPKNPTNKQHHQQLRHLATKILTPSLNDIKLNEIWIDGPKCDSNGLENCDSFDSLECLDRQLLRQLNEHDMDIHDTVNLQINSDSRPISLLSVNSTDTANSLSLFSNSTNKNSEDETTNQTKETNLTYKQKLEDLKQSYDQMIFKQSYKEMESLHKTLESFLNIDQASKLKMMMKPIKSTTLTSANDLNKQFIATLSNKPDLDSQTKTTDLNMSKSEKDKRLSRILSPTRFRPAPQIQTDLINLDSNFDQKTPKIGSSSSSSSSSSSVLLSSSPISTLSPVSSPNSSSTSQSTYAIPILNSHKHLTSSPIMTNKRSGLNPITFDYLTPVNSISKCNTIKEVSQYSEPFDNLNRTIGKNLNTIFNSNNTLLVVKNIKNSNNSSRTLRTNSTRLSKNDSNNRLFYNFNNQNCALITNHHRHQQNQQQNNSNFYDGILRPGFIPTTVYNTQQPQTIHRLVKIDLNSTNNSVSVPSTPSHIRKLSTIDSTNFPKSNQSTKSTKENTKKSKESILNKIFFSRSKSNSKNQTINLDDLSISEANTSRSSSTNSRMNSKSCFPNNTSSGYDSPSFNDFEKSSSKCTFNNSIIGGTGGCSGTTTDLLSSSGYESLTKDINTATNCPNINQDDSSDCITTASSLSGDVKFSTLSRLKSDEKLNECYNKKGFGLKNQKLISNLKQFSYSNVNNENNCKNSVCNNHKLKQQLTMSKAVKLNKQKPIRTNLNSFCGSSLNLFSITCLQATKLAKENPYERKDQQLSESNSNRFISL